MAGKIAVITTGGTIGSIFGAESVAVDPTGERLRQEIEQVAGGRGTEFEIVSAINKNSEDLEPIDWIAIAEEVRACAQRGFSRMVVLHGTDTTAFTCAVLGGFFNCGDLRICVTGSYLAPSAADSDAALSIAAAIACVASDRVKPGVYVASRSGEANVSAQIMPALALKPAEFDGLSFESAYSTVCAVYSPGGGLRVLTDEPAFNMAPFADCPIPDGDTAQEASGRVGILTLHPGLDRQQVEGSAAGKDYLVLIPYHSGTGPSTERSGLVKYLRQRGGNGPEMLLSQFPGVNIARPYASTVSLARMGCRIYSHMQAHVLFSWAVVSIAVGQSRSEFLDIIEPFAMLNE